jgi:2-dehydro-3-deoxy-D-arabinonate dehydratase
MHLFKTQKGWVVENEGRAVSLSAGAGITSREDLHSYLNDAWQHSNGNASPDSSTRLAPIEQQEVWAAGVTYYRSRSARMAESEAGGGTTFYDKVYTAQRPELFFKGTPHRVASPGENVRIRRDSNWNVPEPELTLLISPGGKILGYTIGNDMSSRDIEGENPLYLPQAKVYDRSCALGPAILVTPDPLPSTTEIGLEIRRAGQLAFSGATSLAELKRRPEELVHYLFRESSFPNGCFLLTGTGIVPPDGFTLQSADEISIRIDAIGILTNTVE